MTEAEYTRLKPMILEQPIPVLQQKVREGAFTYEDLCRFFLYRIYKYELDNSTTLNTILALNLQLIQQAREGTVTRFSGCLYCLKTISTQRRCQPRQGRLP